MNRALALVPLLALASGCAVTNPGAAGDRPSVAVGASAGTVTCQYRVTGTPSKPVDPPSTTDVPATGTAVVTLQFAGGPVQITLDRAAAPCTAHSFETLAQQGYFTGTACHRLGDAQGFHILQCGDPTGRGSGGPGYTFDDELAQTKSYPKGTVAMANAGKNTNGSQFFLVFGDTGLPPAYTVFGRMDDAGTGVIAAIAAGGIGAGLGDGSGRPVADATIKGVALG